jgi:hypothetical protein
MAFYCNVVIHPHNFSFKAEAQLPGSEEASQLKWNF